MESTLPWLRQPVRGTPARRPSAPAAAPAGVAGTRGTVLCVDLDGTLIAGDLLFECLLRALRRRPWLLLWLPVWLLHGRAALKRRLAEAAALDVRWLPYREEVLQTLREEHARGRRIVLATAADRSLAERVAAHLGLFDEVLASAPGRNLKGTRKRDALVARYGEGGFDYVGDALADLPLWQAAAGGVAVQPGWRLRRHLRASGPGGDLGTKVRTLEAGPQRRWRAWPRALRVHQWAKNVLVFVPLVAAQAVTDAAALVAALAAFVALSLCASGTYLLNDLLDLESDRQHRSKCRRPFASGALPVAHGLVLSPALLAAGLALAAAISPGTAAMVAVYVASTTLYSFWLKRKMLVDVFALALLYTLRVLIGSEATGVATSAWLLGFSIFTFLSLGAAKRVAELVHLTQSGRDGANGRDYFVWDRHAVAMLGHGAAVGAAVVMALYVHSDSVRALYAQPTWLWTWVVLVLYWLARAWMVTLRGAMHDDPIVFAATDRLTWAVLALGGLAMAAARWAPFGLPGMQP